jgi:hypothetical protein
MTDKLLTPAEAAVILSTTPKALDHRRRSGEIAFVPLGRLIRYRQSTVLAFIADNERTASPRRRGRQRVIALVPKEHR